jgi:hypothetical protein
MLISNWDRTCFWMVFELRNVMLIYVFSLVLLLMVGGFSSSFVAAQQSASSQAISDAQSRLISCFNAAHTAETAGANISRLTNTLNDAGALLSNAEHAYSIGNFTNAQRLAVESQNLLTGFVSEATSLTATAKQDSNMDFLVNVVGSVVGTILVLVGSIIVWRIIKKKYTDSEEQTIESVAV